MRNQETKEENEKKSESECKPNSNEEERERGICERKRFKGAPVRNQQPVN